jgi:hypothetical protein
MNGELNERPRAGDLIRKEEEEEEGTQAERSEGRGSSCRKAKLRAAMERVCADDCRYSF